MRFSLALSTVALACVAAAPVLMATPALAYGQGGHVRHHRTHYYSREYYRDYSGYMDPRSGHYDPQFQRNRENFGFSGRDPSRVGGEDPNLHPPGLGH